MIQYQFVQNTSTLLWQQYQNFGSIKKVLLADLGEKIKQATIQKWHVKEGQAVKAFQYIADVETDKLFTQIPTEYTGKIHKLLHKEESMCQVGGILYEIEIQEDVNQAETPKPSSTAAPAVQASTTPAASSKTGSTTNSSSSTNANSDYSEDQNLYVLAAPSVRAIARERKINLQNVRGSGKDGRIMKEDIINFYEGKQQTNQPSVSTGASHPPQASSPTADLKASKTIIKMSNFQQGMQQSMTQSNRIPHLYLKEEYDLTNLLRIRESIKKGSKLNISIMAFFMKAFSLSLKDYPAMNSLYNQETPFEYTLMSSHNISIAVDSPKGLFVPNIQNCQQLSIIEINQEINRLKQESENGTLGPQDLYDGTISISNIGTIGGTYTGPLILPPQVCIVGLGRTQTLPRYNEKQELKPRQIMYGSFGCDHRVLDGATVTRFSNQWKSYLENPESMLLHLK